MIMNHNSYMLFPVLNTLHVSFNYHTTPSFYPTAKESKIGGPASFHVLPQKPRSWLLMHGRCGLSAGGMVSNGPPSLPPDGTDRTLSLNFYLFACLQTAETKTKSAIP